MSIPMSITEINQVSNFVDNFVTYDTDAGTWGEAQVEYTYDPTRPARFGYVLCFPNSEGRYKLMRVIPSQGSFAAADALSSLIQRGLHMRVATDDELRNLREAVQLGAAELEGLGGHSPTCPAWHIVTQSTDFRPEACRIQTLRLLGLAIDQPGKKKPGFFNENW